MEGWLGTHPSPRLADPNVSLIIFLWSINGFLHPDKDTDTTVTPGPAAWRLPPHSACLSPKLSTLAAFLFTSGPWLWCFCLETSSPHLPWPKSSSSLKSQLKCQLLRGASLNCLSPPVAFSYSFILS